MLSYSRRRAFRFLSDVDDASALCADATTVNRQLGQGRFSSIVGLREPYIRLEAAIRGSITGPWVGMLIRAAIGARPMKWHHVAYFIMNGSGAEWLTVCDGLASQVLVVTDPMELAREVDLRVAKDSSGIPICAAYLIGAINTSAHGGTRRSSLDIRHWIAEDLLDSTGYGTVENLIEESSRSVLPTTGIAVDRARLLNQLNGSIREVTKVASRSMMLVIHERDPESAERDALIREARLTELQIFGSDAAFAQIRLRRIAEARMVFDSGEAKTTRIIDSVRATAEQATAFNLLDEPTARGYARDEDDAQSLRLQIADIVAGYAKAVMEDVRYAHRGLHELTQRFRLIFYNGRRLGPSEASRIDRDRQRHRELLGRFAASIGIS